MVKERSLVGIQYLRGAAALMVVLDHCSGMMGMTKYFGVIPFGGALTWGSVGVDLFFVISGFIIAYVTLAPGSLQPKTGVLSYLHRRFARIIPFLWVCVISYGLLKLIGRGGFSITPYLRALFLIPGGPVQPNAVWTLRHEVLFYALFATALVWGRLRFLPVVLWVLSPLVALAMNGPAWFVNDQSLPHFFFNPLNLLFGSGLAAGFLVLKNGMGVWRIRGAFPLLMVAAFGLTPLAAELGYDRMHVEMVIPMGIVCALILLFSTTLEVPDQAGPLHRLAGTLGDASYAVYLTHEAFISAMLGVLAKHAPHANTGIVLVVVSVLAVLAGVAVHFLVEKPLIERFRPSIAGRLKASSNHSPQTMNLEPRTSNLRRFKRLAVALLVLAVLCELGLRLFGLGRPLLYEATSYGYRVRPDQDLKRFGHTLHYNSLGLRGDEITPLPAAGVTRILCLGDSITFGGVLASQNQTYPADLEADLDKDGLKAQVLNASAGGWALGNELGWLRANSIMHSQIVVLQVNTDDFFQPMVPSSIVGHHVAFPDRNPPLAIGELIERYLLPRLGLVNVQDPGAGMGGEMLDQVPPNLKTIESMVGEVRAAGARPVVLYMEPPGWARSKAPDVKEGERRFLDLLQQLHVPIIRPGNALAVAGDRSVFRDNIHPNIAGNQIVARRLAEGLMAVLRS